ncbi:MAG: hypothetical protein ACRD1X_18795 [Vicinamibacteria bacterium]
MYNSWHLDAQHERRGFGIRGLSWRVEFAVRNAGRFLAVLAVLMVAAVIVGVAFQVRVEHRPPERRVVFVPITVRDTVLMEVGEGADGGEKDERGDLETANHAGMR